MIRRSAHRDAAPRPADVVEADEFEGSTNGAVHGVGRVRRVLDSPTLMTWASLGTRAGGMLLVLPLVLTRLTAEEIAVWYLLMTLVGFQAIADMGFAPTFTRVVAFAMGGSAQLRDLRSPKAFGDGVPNWEVVERVWGTMHVLYFRLALIFAPVFGGVGVLALAKPIAALPSPASGWVSLAIVVLTFGVVVRANAFGAYLQGVNQVALLRRWEALTGLAATATAAAVLLLGGNLVALVLGHQGWMLLSAMRDRSLARRVEEGRAVRFRTGVVDRDVFAAVWSSAVRSGVGVALSRGVTMSSGLILAQFTAAAPLASYLLANRVLQLVVDLANAPFYSKIPTLARFRSEGRALEIEELAARGMRLAYWAFTVVALAVTVVAGFGLDIIGSSVPWVAAGLWVLMVSSAYVERFGAMHLQLYSTTNDIVWHIANGVTGSLYLCASLLLLGRFGLYAFPMGSLLGYAAFYSWYGPLKVYRAFDIRFWRFQIRTALFPTLVLLSGLIFALFCLG